MAKPTTEKLMRVAFLFFFLSFGFCYGRRALLQDPATDRHRMLAGVEAGAGLVNNAGDKAGSASGTNAGGSNQVGLGGVGGLDSCPGFSIGAGIITGPVGQFAGTFTVPGLGTITVPIIGIPLLHDQSLIGSAKTATSEPTEKYGIDSDIREPPYFTPPMKTEESSSSAIEASGAPAKITESPLPPDEVHGEDSMP